MSSNKKKRKDLLRKITNKDKECNKKTKEETNHKEHKYS